ncbi:MULTISPECIES: ribonuclease III [unclassified Aureispira]|uniref:ribonuclease III n=1 Tax=unclassified Aureispira TaxID=2649989 RepID=UPI000697FFB0|nr:MULTISPECIES: ribonuclease III [unclassified Aureispira]WMX15008.1 ribonuclease III [Aureispira sp. CCB-E]
MVRKIYNLTLSTDKAFVKELRKILGFTPKHVHFYKRAFTHKSLTSKEENTKTRYPTNNERLEFLGDAILDSVTAEYLFRKYPTQDEGFLTQMRSKMVNRKALNKIAEHMELDIFLRQLGATRISQTMMGNTFEAFVGAVYLDVGYRQTKSFIINKMLRQYIDVHELESVNTNYKSQLLEYSQKNQKTISYDVLDHYRTKNNRERFKIAVLLDGKALATAEDYSKKSAEQKASEKALIQMGVLKKEGKNKR